MSNTANTTTWSGEGEEKLGDGCGIRVGFKEEGVPELVTQGAEEALLQPEGGEGWITCLTVPRTKGKLRIQVCEEVASREHAGWMVGGTRWMWEELELHFERPGKP